MKKKCFIWCIGLMAAVAAILSSCGQQKVEYKVTASGDSAEAGIVTVLDYSINVYKDLESNSCGNCVDQPVHLYAGADSEEVTEAIGDVVERADDLWEVVSCEGNTVVLREKEAGTVDSIGMLSAPEGITLTGTVSGRDVPVISGKQQEAEVEFPKNPQRLAAVYGPSYELLTMLGAEDKIVVRADVQTADFPWAEKVFSRINKIPVLNNVHTSVNFEELMKYEPEIVYTFPRENELTQLKKAGVAVLSAETEETLEGVKNQVRNYAATLGKDAEERAEEYCKYFDEKLNWIKERTDKIDEKERPDVYYAGVDILTTYGKHSDIIQVIESAGGNPVSCELNAGNRTQIDYEQLMAWNPDIIFIDHGGMNDGKTAEELKKEIQSKSVYKSLNAVKNQQVYASPSGVFYWDMGIQRILLIMNMAKILHPDEFEDLDMEEEIMIFYEKFFDYSLTREDAEKILNRENP